jgi:hypothetical protein
MVFRLIFAGLLTSQSQIIIMPHDARNREPHPDVNRKNRMPTRHYQEQCVVTSEARDTFNNTIERRSSVGTAGENQALTLGIALALLPTKVDKVYSLLTQIIESNRDPYLAHRIKPAVQALRVGNLTATRYWLERAVGYLQTRQVHR